MLMTTIIHPEAFDRNHFAVPGYRDQAEMLFRGIESNGVILVDPNGRLLDELSFRIEGLGSKEGQQLQIRLAELQKQRRARIIKVNSSVCQIPPMAALLDISRRVRDSCNADTLVVDGASKELLMQLGVPEKHLTLLAEYIRSDHEDIRRRFMENLPPVDQMSAGEFESHIVRCTRFARLIRFYDKQIGHGSSLSRYRRGIETLLRLWLDNAHFRRNELRVEIYTCVPPHSVDPIDVVYNRVLTNLTQALAQSFSVGIALYYKQDSSSITHDRYLQTEAVTLYFSKGFDFINEDNSLQRCSVKIDNGILDHLHAYRQLPDFKPPYGRAGISS
jgi:hypothetical protein